MMASEESRKPDRKRTYIYVTAGAGLFNDLDDVRPDSVTDREVLDRLDVMADHVGQAVGTTTA